jgi:hypothetical protein
MATEPVTTTTTTTLPSPSPSQNETQVQRQEEPAPTPVMQPQEQKPQVKHSFYQNDDWVYVTLFVRDVKEQDLTVTFDKQSVSS